MSLPTRNVSVQTYPNLNSGVLLKEDGYSLLKEDGFEILLENPSQNPNLNTRNVSSFNSLPVRN
jgi:hypothetical protein